MKQQDLPQRWQNKIIEYLQSIGSKYKTFGISNFQHDLRIEFVDRSNAFFYYAFYLIDEESNEIAVFTEHCGYHLFPMIDTKLEIIERNGNIIKIEHFTTE